MLGAAIIRHSTSPCASPIVIVRKSNGVDIRLCIDYKLWLLSRAHDGLGSRDDARRVNVYSNGANYLLA
ncbi:reverse transcriptase [Phytophthora megakarya]|uniref:Reverse transcriptase n=1 Tax=Phytophthora megakarya TaxID=4795 RepID=A0A225UNC0_9STRA|nr:reverse transcriptase [Phytophthora megakarya]